MSTNYPDQPQGPSWGQQQPGYPQPPVQPKKRSKARLGCLGCGGILAAAIVIGAIAAVAGSSSGGSSSSTTPSSMSSSSPKAAPQQSTVGAFKAYVKGHESAKTREAITHVTKVQGADENNNIMDTADIYTNYSGGLTSADAGNAKLLASAFADFQSSRGKASKNGLVTVYSADGDILSNGNH